MHISDKIRNFALRRNNIVINKILYNMEETEFLRDFEGIKDYRTFLVGLDKQFKSASMLYREFKILEGDGFYRFKD